MPEGDTLYKIAKVLDERGRGHVVARAQMLGRPAPELERRRILRVDVHGKHVIFVLSPNSERGWWLRVHLGMHGQWHRYPPGARWKRPRSAASVVIDLAEEGSFVCFYAEHIALERPLHLDEEKAAQVSYLGPQLLAMLPVEPIVAAVRARPATMPMCDVLLDQRLAAGFGNVYKSELLFLSRVHPATLAGTVSDSVLISTFALGQVLLARNVGGWARTITVDRRRQRLPRGVPRVYTYNRTSKPCLICYAPIVGARMGRHDRTTFWCPQCQPPLSVGDPSRCRMPTVDPLRWRHQFGNLGALPA